MDPAGSQAVGRGVRIDQDSIGKTNFRLPHAGAVRFPALPQQNRYPTKMVASNKMLPKIGEAIAWEEASARWQSESYWQQYVIAT